MRLCIGKKNDECENFGKKRKSENGGWVDVRDIVLNTCENSCKHRLRDRRVFERKIWNEIDKKSECGLNQSLIITR